MEMVGSYLKVIMPITMIALSFFLKLWIVNIPKAPDYLKAIIELPVTISFLGVAMFISYAITTGVDGKQHSDGIAYFAISLFLTLIVIAAWRCCCTLFNKEYWKRMVLCSILNYVMAIFCAVISIAMVVGG